MTEDRKDKFDLTTYRLDTITFEASTSGRVGAIGRPADISGLTIGVNAGTNQEQILLDWNRQNEAAGLAPQIAYYPNTGDYYLALDSGRVDAYLGPNPRVAYHVATTGRTKIVGSMNGGGTCAAKDSRPRRSIPLASPASRCPDRDHPTGGVRHGGAVANSVGCTRSSTTVRTRGRR